MHPTTVSKWESGKQPIELANLEKAGVLLGVDLDWLRDGDRGEGVKPLVMRESRVYEQRTPYATATRKLPSRAREHVYRYLDQLEGLGVPDDEVEEVERLMVESTFNKLHVHDPRERTEDELILDIDAAWDFVRYVMRKRGIDL